MASKLELLIIHVSDTPAGRNVSSTDIRQWHLGPKQEADGVIYLGNKYPTLSALPPEKIGGVSITRLKGRGWRQVGYADMIHLNGSIENLVPYNNDDIVDAWEITNGVAGINKIARHIVLVGGRTADNKSTEDTRTEMQHAVLEGYVKKTIEIIPTIRVAGHNQFDAHKACPCFSVPQWALSIGLTKKNIYDKWPS